jgi:hypothetical protein
MAEKTVNQMNTYEKIEAGVYILTEFTEAQVDFIKGLVKFSYTDGFRDGYNDLEGKIYKALNGDQNG